MTLKTIDCSLITIFLDVPSKDIATALFKTNLIALPSLHKDLLFINGNLISLHRSQSQIKGLLSFVHLRKAIYSIIVMGLKMEFNPGLLKKCKSIYS